MCYDIIDKRLLECNKNTLQVEKILPYIEIE